MTIRISWNNDSVVSDGDTNSLVSSINVIEFDGVDRLDAQQNADLSTFAVETGVSISDHKRRQPFQLTIDGLVSNTPNRVPPPSGVGDSSRIQMSVQKVTQGNSSFANNVFSGTFDRVQDCWNNLKILADNPIIVTIETQNQTYENMVLVGLQDTRTAPHWKGTKFITKWQEIVRAETIEIEIPQPRTVRAQQENNSANAPVQERDRSLANILLRG